MCEYCDNENPLAGAVATLVEVVARHSTRLEETARVYKAERNKARDDLQGVQKALEEAQQVRERQLNEMQDTMNSQAEQLTKAEEWATRANEEMNRLEDRNRNQGYRIQDLEKALAEWERGNEKQAHRIADLEIALEAAERERDEAHDRATSREVELNNLRLAMGFEEYTKELG